MARIFPAVYVVKVIKLDGTVITSKLPVSDVRFTERLAIPGRQTLGSWSATLVPARGPQAHHLATYKQLDYMQRVEIYENEATGTPVFSGQIEDLPTNIVAGGVVSGPEWLARLSQRKTRHFEFIGGEQYRTFDAYGIVTVAAGWTMDDQLDQLLKPWQWQSRDNFNGAIAGDWTQVGTWTTELLDGYQRLKATGSSNILHRPLGISGPKALSYRVYADIRTGAKNATWTQGLIINRAAIGKAVHVEMTHTANEEFTLVRIVRNKRTVDGEIADVLEQRQASKWEIPFNEFVSFDLWVYDDASTKGKNWFELYLNDRQFIVAENTQATFGGQIALFADQADTYFDNYILWAQEYDMLPSISTTTFQDDTEYTGDSYLQAISSICDLVDFYWRTDAGAGIGQDTIEIGPSIGTDKSATIRFEEGKALASLSLNPSAQNLVTYLRFKGQGQQQFQRLAAAFDFDAWDNYGIVEGDINDNRISTNLLARKKVDNELVKLKDGIASLDAVIVDTPKTTGQWRIGDEVWIKSTEPDLNQKVRVVEVECTTNDPRRRVTFQSFPRSRSGNIGRLMDDTGKQYRGTRGNATKITYSTKFESWWIDDRDSRMNYVEDNVTLSNEQWFDIDDRGDTPFDLVPGIQIQARKRTCHGNSLKLTNNEYNTATFGFYGTGFTLLGLNDQVVVDYPDHYYEITVDEGTAQEKIFQKSIKNNSEPATGKRKVVIVDELSTGYHSVKIQKQGPRADNPNVFITIDAVMLHSLYWPLFVEGRAVSHASLYWEHNKQTNSFVHLRINGKWVTTALGGPWQGSVDFENRINVLPYISRPGLHQLEFEFRETNAAGEKEEIHPDEELSPQLEVFIDLEVLI